MATRAVNRMKHGLLCRTIGQSCLAIVSALAASSYDYQARKSSYHCLMTLRYTRVAIESISVPITDLVMYYIVMIKSSFTDLLEPPETRGSFKTHNPLYVTTFT
jgi:hypothetical protein